MVMFFESVKMKTYTLSANPPNSTHLMEPLDIAFFGLMITVWTTVLAHWKATPAGMSFTVLLKQFFPPLLKQVLEMLEPKFNKTLESGFQKCRIFPCDIQL